MLFIGSSLSAEIISQLGSGYRLQDSHIYYKEALIMDADVATFEILKFRDKRKWAHDFIHFNSPIDYEYSIYAKDKRAIYYQGKRLSLIDSTTFEWIGFGYSKDKNHVYYDGKLLAQADPISFVTIGHDLLGGAF